MSDYYKVIHGIGKPRILSSEADLWTDIVSVGDDNSITLTTGYSGTTSLTNRWVESVDSNKDNIYAKILSVSGKKLTVDQWYGGDVVAANVPLSGATVYIKGFIVDLPYCENLSETFSLQAILHQLIGRKVLDKKGWWYSANLSYNSYLKKEILQALEPIFNLSEGNFYFIPRCDNPDIIYAVCFKDDYELTFQQLSRHSGHLGTQLNFLGVERYTDINLTNEPVYYEYGYGDYYGYIN